ncbi:MAG: hypothetical protein IJE27_05700 [Anaerotignum sp.]|nr:hypothetical protein [Anaerotignum sp.]
MRKNFVCIISEATYGEHDIHQIQANGGWTENPKLEGYVLVPDDMVEGIMETRGFCDITVENGVVTSFTAREIPDIPDQEPEAEKTVYDEMAEAYREGVNSVG